MKRPLPFAVGSSQGRSTVTRERLVNAYAVLNPPGSESKYSVHGTPGLKPWLPTIGTGVIRGMCVMGNYLYVVVGEELYRVSANQAVYLVGSMPGMGPVIMDTNGVEVVIVTGQGAYAATETSIIAVPHVDPIDVIIQDGYAVYIQRNSAQFIISGINDAANVDPLDFATAESKPDHLISGVSVNRELWLFGPQSIEVWYNSGDAQFPFARNGAGVINRGCLAAGSVCVIGGQVLWLGDDGVVYISSGYVPQRISSHAVEFAIGNYLPHIQQAATSYGYSQEGHIYYVLNFSSGTWVYDLSTGLWHERQSYQQTRWKAGFFAAAFGKLLVSDVAGNSIYELDLDTYDEDGEVIQRIIYQEPIGDRVHRHVMHDYEVIADVGEGLPTGQGSDPKIILDWSDDGGRLWSSQLWRSFGAMGQYEHRVRWTRLGMFRHRTMRLMFTDPVKFILHGAYADIEALND